MDAAYNDALAFVLRWEGGFVDDPADRGGRTMKGVTQNVYNAWRASQGKPPGDVKNIADDELAAIYQNKLLAQGALQRAAVEYRPRAVRHRGQYGAGPRGEDPSSRRSASPRTARSGTRRSRPATRAALPMRSRAIARSVKTSTSASRRRRGRTGFWPGG